MNAMSNDGHLEMIDTYAHLGLPRFIRSEEFLQIMDQNSIQRAIIASADTCPDIPEISRAIVEHGGRFRAVGVPLGNSLTEIEESIRHQAACGFLGIRIFDRMIAEFPTLLNLIGDSGMIPWVVGGPGLSPAAHLLVKYLENSTDHRVVAPHFGGMADPAVLDAPGQVQELFSHPHFLVIFSRHGAYPVNEIRAWAKKLITVVGWGRIMFGSEFPVCLWRNESYTSTMKWVKTLDLPFAQESQRAFYGQNAAGLLWEFPTQPARPVDQKYSSENWHIQDTVPLFANQGIDFPVHLHRKILARYLNRVDPALDYKSFVSQMLREMDF